MRVLGALSRRVPGLLVPGEVEETEEVLEEVLVALPLLPTPTILVAGLAADNLLRRHPILGNLVEEMESEEAKEEEEEEEGDPLEWAVDIGFEFADRWALGAAF